MILIRNRGRPKRILSKKIMACSKPIRNHVRKSHVTNMGLTLIFLGNPCYFLNIHVRKSMSSNMGFNTDLSERSILVNKNFQTWVISSCLTPIGPINALWRHKSVPWLIHVGLLPNGTKASDELRLTYHKCARRYSPVAPFTNMD